MPNSHDGQIDLEGLIKLAMVSGKLFFWVAMLAMIGACAPMEPGRPYVSGADAYCPPGEYGLGGIYPVRPEGMGKCVKGAVVIRPFDYCPPGPYGRGGVFDTMLQKCISGSVTSKDWEYCAPGKHGEGGQMDPRISYCFEGVVLGLSQLFCEPGRQGRGGVYFQRTSACNDGKIRTK